MRGSVAQRGIQTVGLDACSASCLRTLMKLFSIYIRAQLSRIIEAAAACHPSKFEAALSGPAREAGVGRVALGSLDHEPGDLSQETSL